MKGVGSYRDIRFQDGTIPRKMRRQKKVTHLPDVILPVVPWQAGVYRGQLGRQTEEENTYELQKVYFNHHRCKFFGDLSDSNFCHGSGKTKSRDGPQGRDGRP